MLTDSEIAGMRDTSASALPDTCTITRVSSTATLDEDTGDVEPDDPEVIYAGPCRVRARDAIEQDIQSGDLHETTAPYMTTLPALASAPGVIAGDPSDVVIDDYVVVTASSDTAMIGRAFQVRHVGWSSWQIDRRLGVEDREQPRGLEAGS